MYTISYDRLTSMTNDSRSLATDSAHMFLQMVALLIDALGERMSYVVSQLAIQLSSVVHSFGGQVSDSTDGFMTLALTVTHNFSAEVHSLVNGFNALITSAIASSKALKGDLATEIRSNIGNQVFD